MYKNVISVHGTPRSGTTWLGQIFDSSPLVRYKYQPLFSDSFKDRITVRSGVPEIRDFFEEVYNRNDEFLNRTKQKQKGIHKDFKEKLDNPPFLLIKMVRYHYLIPVFLESLDNIKVIGIVRNPCGTLNSWRKAPREFLPEHDFRKNWRFAQDRSNFRPEEYYGFHRWKELTMMFMVMKERFPEKFTYVRYEDLFAKTGEITRELFSFCGLKMAKQTLEFIRESRSFHQEDLYSVYKGKKKMNDWKGELDESIINEIYDELRGTEFERFLEI